MGRAGCARGWLIPGAEGLQLSRVTLSRGGEGEEAAGISGLAAGPQAQLLRVAAPLTDGGTWPSVVLCALCGLGQAELPLSCPCWWPCQGSPTELGRHRVMLHQNSSVAYPAAGSVPPGQSLLPGLQEKQSVPIITVCSAEHLLQH